MDMKYEGNADFSEVLKAMALIIVTAQNIVNNSSRYNSIEM